MPDNTYFAGVDVGSTMTKVAIMNQGLVASVIGPTGAEHRHLAYKVMEQALGKAGISFELVSFVVATGYGRINVPFADKQITEISCHAKGVCGLFPQAKTIIDIGGQDSKGIKVRDGKVIDFVMNDKCAAGTGRFLEVIAEALGVRLEEMGPKSLRARGLVKVSNTCTVFAEQEVVSHLAEGVPTEDIIAGLHAAIANRVCNMAERLRIEPEVVVTGGGAKNAGLVKAIQDRLKLPVSVPPEPLLTGAIGAALHGRELVARGVAATAERKLEQVTFFGSDAR